MLVPPACPAEDLSEAEALAEADRDSAYFALASIKILFLNPPRFLRFSF